jgi:hypothetical protein
MSMDEKTRTAYKEAFTRKEKGESWSTITQFLKDSGHRNSKGKPFAESTLRKEYSTLKKDPEKWRSIMGEDLSSEQDERSEQETPESRTAEAPPPSDWEDRMREIAEDVCQPMLQNIRNEMKELVSVPHVAHVQNDMEVPPEPVTTGRRQNRVYGKLSATTDGVLMDLFAKEAKARRMSTSRLMDVILWQRYGKPVLSYEVPEGPELDDLKKRYKKARKKLQDA